VGAELAKILGTNTHVHAEWTKHGTWVRGSTPVEDDLNNAVGIPIRAGTASSFELIATKRNGAYVCTVRDDFMKQRGATVAYEFNGVVEHHDGPEPIVSSTCKID
jgi:hypothetical protein